MRYDYFEPAPDLRRYLGSYYIMDMPQGGGGPVRVGIPHIRFLIGGESVLDDGDCSVVMRSPSVVACGPVIRAGHVSVTPGTVIFAVSLTPLGWHSLLGVPMHELANRKPSLDDLLPTGSHRMQDRLLSARDDSELIGAVDDFFRSLKIRQNRIDTGFLGEASKWLLDRESPGVDILRQRLGISSRQLDRLCNDYFGGPPKRLHRMFRALHVSNAMAWTGETDWRKVVGERYYDQSHFIKDFKDLIGCTPGEYVNGPNMMIRFDLMKRLEISHPDGFSLIG